MIKKFVESLGWPSPSRYEHSVQDRSNVDLPKRLVWYESGSVGNPRTDCFLQLNELGCEGQSVLLAGAVYALRYRLCTGWHPIELSTDQDKFEQSLNYVSPWLNYDNFHTLEMRRAFRKLHPETANYSWTSIRERGSPYYVVVDKSQRPVIRQYRGSGESV